jgi:hypothetical protein
MKRTLPNLDRKKLVEFIKENIKATEKFCKGKVKGHEYGAAERSEGVLDAYHYILDKIRNGRFDSTKVSTIHTPLGKTLANLGVRLDKTARKMGMVRKKATPATMDTLPAAFCEHANEVPMQLECPCPSNCPCKTGTCKNLRRIRNGR